ncbi:hypothetical protein ACA910_001328 [Epithemia clementina (nom. ined.)]
MTSACIRCGSERSTKVHDGAGAKKDVDVRRCSQCQLAFQDGWTLGFEEELYGYYADQALTREHWHGALNADRHRESFIASPVASRAPVSSMQGAAPGTWWRPLASRAGTPAASTSPLSAIAICQQLGVPCQLLDFFGTEVDGERFDVLHMSELIEHVPAPQRFIQRAAELLADDGLLYLTTPNFRSLSHYALGGAWTTIHREHLSYFDTSTLRSLLASVPELEVESLISRNVAVAPLLRAVRERVTTTLGQVPAPASPASTPAAPLEDAAKTAWEADQALRARLQTSPVLKKAKDLVNRLLDAAGAGDSLVALCRRKRRD